MKRLTSQSIAAAFILLMFTLAANPSMARALPGESGNWLNLDNITVDYPNIQLDSHYIGKIGLSITNFGNIGSGFYWYGDGMTPVLSCEYPFPSYYNYLFTSAFWIGAIVGQDTLVSVGADGWTLVREFWPDFVSVPGSGIEHHSINDPDDHLAVSEQDHIARYTDTLTDERYTGRDTYDARPHIPLNIEMTQRSYGWSYPDVEDFVIFDCSIKNIGNDELKDVYVGIHVDGDVGRVNGGINDANDDICGFRRTVASPQGCGFIDTVNIAWTADNNGRTSGNEQKECPEAMDITGVTGIRILHIPSDDQGSFNWWVSNGDASLDFGPRLAGTDDDPFRDYGGFLGTPEGDRNKYYILRHKEIDYDQLFTAVDHTADGWLAPPGNAVDLADGADTRYLLSFGPFDIMPGQSLPFAFAYVAGENFHTNCMAFDNLFDPSAPEAFYNQLDFSDLALNALRAGWVYDRPGFDTDGDGYLGKYRICGEDTIYYEGDGIPDYYVETPTDNPGEPGLPRIPDDFTLHQNYPNPFNASTEISFEIPARSDVTLTIYNILGEEVRKMAVGNKPAGKYTITWDGADDSRHSVSSGVYFYKITAGTFAGSKKMILLK
jgi:hypothetical protein